MHVLILYNQSHNGNAIIFHLKSGLQFYFEIYLIIKLLLTSYFFVRVCVRVIFFICILRKTSYNKHIINTVLMLIYGKHHETIYETPIHQKSNL